MPSWAAVAKSTAEPLAADQTIVRAGTVRVAVVDANAIIHGLQLHTIADVAVTVPEVFNEIRDKNSRQYLESLPFTLRTREPAEESSQAVIRFARETGDIHSLSAVDIKLLALAHTLEVEAHGSAHIRQHPVKPVVRSKVRGGGQKLPGWGTVPNPEDWAAIDEVPDAPAGVAVSRIQEAVAAGQQLDGGQLNMEAGDAEGAGGGGEGGSSGEEEGGADGGDWEVAAKSKNAQRRRWRKQRQRQDRQQQQQEHWQQEQEQWLQEQQEVEQQQKPAAEVHQGEQEGAGACSSGAGQMGDSSAAAEAAKPAAPAGAAAAAAEAEAAAAEGTTTAADGIAAVEEGVASFALSGELLSDAEEDEDGDGDGNGDEDEDGEEDEGGAAASDSEGSIDLEDELEFGGAADEGGAGPTVESSVVIVTADFAMQNVVLQLGLQLVAPNGARITRLSRWALRCGACCFVTKEAGRVFCPRCGNMTMERVEVAVGPDGAEYYGVRRRHVLRGTKYSLPKPRGGRQAARNPILREDMLLMRGRRKQKKAKDSADAFAPEYNEETWHTAHQQATTQGVVPLAASWKNNPNERRNVRLNRRK